MFKERCQKSKRTAYLVKSIQRCHLDVVDYALRNLLTTQAYNQRTSRPDGKYATDRHPGLDAQIIKNFHHEQGKYQSIEDPVNVFYFVAIFWGLAQNFSDEATFKANFYRVNNGSAQLD